METKTTKNPTPKVPKKTKSTVAKREDGREEAWFGCGWRNW